MKKFITILTFLLIILFSSHLSAQAPPPPPPDHGETGNQNGGNAPIGSGLAILLGLGAAYGTKKLLQNKKEEIE